METAVRSSLDQAIEEYKSQHNGEKPLYCVMSTEEADELTDAIRREKGRGGEEIITSYRDIKIIRNNLTERGQYLLVNELPDTGS